MHYIPIIKKRDTHLYLSLPEKKEILSSDNRLPRIRGNIIIINTAKLLIETQCNGVSVFYPVLFYLYCNRIIMTFS